jgi:hypothetical protein
METLERRIRILLLIFIAGLVLSGFTAIPLESELRAITNWAIANGLQDSVVFEWLIRVREGVTETNLNHPFIAYGTDWLAFGHFVIAIAFIGPLRDPIKNIWVVEFGMIACILVIPYALIMGAFRDIPTWWRFIDCSFGVLGLAPLWLCHDQIKRLAKLKRL